MIQTYPWFVMAFTGLYTLQDMTENYWQTLFGSFHSWKINLNNEEGRIFGVSVRQCIHCKRRQVSTDRYWHNL
jgi:hypothetical protein